MTLLLSIFGLLGSLGLAGLGGSDNETSNALRATGNTDDETETEDGGDPAPEPPENPNPNDGSSQETVPLFLVNTVTDEVVMELSDGQQIGGAMIGDPNLSILYVPPAGSEAESVIFNNQNGALIRTESFKPYALFGNSPDGDLKASADAPLFTEAGAFSISVTVYDEDNGAGQVIASKSMVLNVTAAPDDEPVEEPVVEEPVVEEPVVEEPVVEEPVTEEPVVEEPVVEEPVTEEPVVEEPVTEEPEAATHFHVELVDTASEAAVGTVANGAVLATDGDGNYTLSVTALDPAFAAQIGSVRLTYGEDVRVENVSPYALFGDKNGDFKGGTHIEGDDLELRIEVFSGKDATGTLLATETRLFSAIVEASEPVVEEPVVEEPVVEEPVVEEPVVEEPVVEEPTGEPPTPAPGEVDGPDQPGESGAGGSTDPVAISGQVQVVTGRVTTLEAPNGDIASVEILSDVANGHVTVNEDNSFALVLTETKFTGNQNFAYKVTYQDGTTSTDTVNLKVVKGTQDSGWATGETHYMLATDENDKIIVETGENHVKVFVSGSADALSLADIAQAEGLNKSQITGEWLAENGGYGHTEGTALAEDAAIALWGELNPRGSTSSNHLLFERGYEYTEFNDRDTLERDVSGEDPLHPILIGAYGEGDKPYLEKGFYQSHGGENVVVQDIHFDGFKWQGDGANLLLDNITVTGNPLELQRIDGITLRNSDITDVHLEESRNGGDWDASEDREQGMFGNFNNGLLLEGNFFDLNGWDIGYDPNHSGDQGQPPSKYSHNIYLGDDNTDVTVRDTITMRGASTGLMVRTGGFIEDNVIVDNNIGLTTLGGDYKGEGPVDNYSLITDNLITSGGHRAALYTGGRPFGINDKGEASSLVDNIVAHLANPNDPAEMEAKNLTHDALTSDSPYYDDTIVWNWKGSDPTGRMTEKNAEHLDKDILNATTIQNFTAQLLGKETATIADLSDHLRAQEAGEIPTTVDAETILRYFQEGFGIDFEERSQGQTLRFEPNALGDGVRWDNRLNWDTEDLPGEIFQSDSVDLGGNHVVFGSNTTIDSLEIGQTGELDVYGGRLTLNGGITGDGEADLNLVHAGQVWSEGGDADELQITTDDAARFVNTGAMSGASLTALDGQAILASDNAEFDLEDGDVLEIHGDAQVGFDGENGGLAILDLHEGSTLRFGNDDGSLGEIGEFRSGAFGDAPDVASGIDLGNATLEIELSGVSAAQSGATLSLMSADELTGIFADAAISGLGARNAEIIVNYEDDTVKLALTNGSGDVTINTIGQPDDISSGSDALWAALTNGQGVANDAQADLVDDEDPLQADAA